MKTIFLSYPMNGIDAASQLQMRSEMINQLILLYPNEELKFIHNGDCPVKENAGRLYYLGQAVSQMDKCDTVAFYPGYKDAKECLIERTVAELYGLEVIEL